MQVLRSCEISWVSGGLIWEGMRESTNVADIRGTQMDGWIDANGMCWAPGTPSSTMYPNGANGPAAASGPTAANGADGDE